MKSLLLALLLLPLSNLAFAFQTGTYCSDQTQTVCAHLEFDQEFVANTPFAFVFQLTTPGSEQVESIDLYLWMPEWNQGTAPVKIDKLAPGKFLVSGVSFPIQGDWEVRAEFDLWFFQQIIIPIYVK